jgi:hypothetical protein
MCSDCRLDQGPANRFAGYAGIEYDCWRALARAIQIEFSTWFYFHQLLCMGVGRVIDDRGGFPCSERR